jgi:transposase
MEVMHKRCAGLDVHKRVIVACVRRTTGRKVERECRTFDTTTTGLLALRSWLSAVGCRLHACRDGSDRGLLEAGVEHPE